MLLLGEEVMEERNRSIKKRKKPLKFTVIYGIILFIATVALAGHVLYHLWWVPRAGAGTPILGYRMDDIPELNESWLRETEAFGGQQQHVDYVELFWNTGPVVYFNVRVLEHTSLSDARLAAADIVAHFIEISHETALDYNLQVVVSYGDIVERRKENQAAVIAHVHEFRWRLAEALLAHAENYPSSDNVSRALNNIDVYENSIIIAAGEAELDDMRSRQAAISVMTAEQEAEWIETHGFVPVYVADHGGDIRNVPPSDISEFPNWGVWNRQHSSIDWN